ncbi:MAG: type II toxin-antitoxin system Phd/YefM family antitoxin [Oscillospiraceae bacterium]|jgi:PHD/YefM family antitoxin component YafN of YafNO toxin-antitoxin module|nr:type II toxin-antitoxin system Phd/YefM family antitoxin [Oscillospiraceae bacterium]
MMTSSRMTGEMLDALVPITRFNRGESGKIFDEVKAAGCKVVVKNNVPTCVLISPERYKELMEELDDAYLLSLALEREATGSGKTYTLEEMLAMDGLTLDALDDDDDEVEFE